MIVRHFQRRAPHGRNGLSWGRVLLAGGAVVSYRLFRRDATGRLHPRFLAFTAADSRSAIARELRVAKRKLRDQVDAIDLTWLEAA